MGKISLHEKHALTIDFLQFLNAKSVTRESIDKGNLKDLFIGREYQMVRRSKGLQTTNFSGLLHYMKHIGAVICEHEQVRFASYNYSKISRPPGVAFNAGYVRKQIRAREKSGKRFFQSQLTSIGRSGQLIKSEDLIEITCLSPSITRNPGEFLQTLEGKESCKMTIAIRNCAKSQRFLVECRFLRKQSLFSVFPVVAEGEKVKIASGRELTLLVTYKVELTEPTTCTTELVFKICKNKDNPENAVCLIRYLRFEKSNELIQSLKPVESYVHAVNISRVLYNDVVPGVRPPAQTKDKLEMKLPLPRCDIPPEVRNAVNSGSLLKRDNTNGRSVPGANRKISTVLESSLNAVSYCERFKLLLFLEELQRMVNMRAYDLAGHTMTKGGNRLLYIDVPCLAEKRPSVLRGDRIYAVMVGEDGVEIPKRYEGFVHVVEMDRVGVGFSPGLLSIHKKDVKFNIHFTFNRLSFKLMHRAVTLIKQSDCAMSALFPKKCGILNPDIKLSRGQFKNPLIGLNREQADAVNNIVRGRESTAPYIIFGPPGTGKTVTMVEAVHQIITMYEGCHVLVCAPSNSACDLLAQRLLQDPVVNKNNVFRMHAASRNRNEIPSDVLKVSNFNTGDFYFPPKKDFDEYEIVVCTLVTAGRLVSAKFPQDHFTHIFIDEAGHALEPECALAIGGLLGRQGQVVLAGDPKQLGPVIMSPIARDFGLGMSLLERLMETEPLYQRDKSMKYNPNFITKLITNYRSQKDIIQIPNQCFYDDELVSVAKSKAIDLSLWEHLPRCGFPVIFHGVQGEDLRECSSPSYFNPQEVSVLVGYVEKLLQLGVKGEDIGLISPYRKQVQKIKRVLADESIKVGSVEEFQGQEREVILISTVRSDSKHLSFDATHHLGFLCSPKRFNVSLTRAKSLLIVIGNPHLLSSDYYWNALLEFCLDNSSYRGIPYDREAKKPVDMGELVKLFTRVVVNDDSDEN